MKDNQAIILYAEDDTSLAFMVKDRLENKGYKVIHCPDGQTAIDNFDKAKFDLCLLDVMMPNKDGYHVAKKIRQQSDQVPIIFLSTKVVEEDRLKGYATGADDYLSKPFSMAELEKKIEVFLRRSKKIMSDQQLSYQIGDITFLPHSLQIITSSETFMLTPKETELLTFLFSHKNRLLKREEILLRVWGKDDFFLGRSMDVFIMRLRKYLRSDESVKLETIHGVGFCLKVPVTDK